MLLIKIIWKWPFNIFLEHEKYHFIFYLDEIILLDYYSLLNSRGSSSLTNSKKKKAKVLIPLSASMGAKLLQSCPTLCDAMDYSPPISSVHGILQARILAWVAISFSRGSSWPRDQTWVSCIAGRFFTIWATREVPPPWVWLILWPSSPP